MLIRKSDYFDRFRCIADRCPDSCCKEWEVQVDDSAAAFYRGLTGPLGDRLRQVLREEDGEVLMTIEDGRCPMWRRDGLCRIQAELGEAALCRTCREFPRLTHDYGDFVEYGLELSCPEAARWILNAQPCSLLETENGNPGQPEYDEEAMAVLLRTREEMLSLLSSSERPIGQTLAMALLYGYQAQSELDGAEPGGFDGEAALDSVRAMLHGGDPEAMVEFFLELELLTPEWEAMLRSPAPVSWDSRTLALARYFTERYWLQAVSDYDLYSRVKFIILACLLVKHLGGDIFRTAQLFSKEIENDADNMDAILDAAYTHGAFTDDKLLSLLLAE